MQEEWTEKYRPRRLKDIIGNEAALQKIRKWSDAWQGGPPRVKALVLEGEPGTGKTSAALALAGDMGWDHIEMNASDQRDATSVEEVAGVGSSTQTFSSSGDFLSSSHGKRKLVILDEADNLFGREDRGGAKAIVEAIRQSGQPIILIVNDYYELTHRSPALKTLAERVVFGRLSNLEVKKVLKKVLEEEGIVAPSQVLDRIVENAGGDLRAAINDLQMMVEGRSELMVAHSEVLAKRNQEKEIETAMQAMFQANSVREARDATFEIDRAPDELIYWVEEYVPLVMRSPEDMQLAFDAVSRADVYLARTRILQHYGLWAYAKDLMTGGVAVSRSQRALPEHLSYRYPSQFIVLGRAKGPRAARDATAGKLAAYYHTSRRCVKESTLDLLSETVRRDEELLIELGKKLGFDESDVAFLLGVEPGSAKIAKVVAKINEGLEVDEEPSESKKRKSSRKRGRLSDF